VKQGWRVSTQPANTCQLRIPRAESYLYEFSAGPTTRNGILGDGDERYVHHHASRRPRRAHIKQGSRFDPSVAATVLRVLALTLRKKSWKTAIPSNSRAVEAWVADDLRECASTASSTYQSSGCQIPGNSRHRHRLAPSAQYSSAGTRNGAAGFDTGYVQQA